MSLTRLWFCVATSLCLLGLLGAPIFAHPKSGYSLEGACLKALESSKVMAQCDWPGCGKKVRKHALGSVIFCSVHHKIAWGDAFDLADFEGLAKLNLPNPMNEAPVPIALNTEKPGMIITSAGGLWIALLMGCVIWLAVIKAVIAIVN